MEEKKSREADAIAKAATELAFRIMDLIFSFGFFFATVIGAVLVATGTITWWQWVILLIAWRLNMTWITVRAHK